MQSNYADRNRNMNWMVFFERIHNLCAAEFERPAIMATEQRGNGIAGRGRGDETGTEQKLEIDTQNGKSNKSKGEWNERGEKMRK